jgi:diguanylate cyclase (GGDEF)-like protein
MKTSTQASVRPRNQLAVWGGIGLGLNVLLALALGWLPSGSSLSRWASDFGNLFIPLALLPLCFQFRGLTPAQRRVPAMLGYSTLVYAIGMVVYLWEVRVLHRQGDASRADLVWLTTYPFLMLAVLGWPGRRTRRHSRAKSVADGVLAASALWSFPWVFLIGPSLMERKAGPMATVLAVMYPLANVVILVCLCQIVAKGIRREFAVPTRLLIASCAMVVAGDLVYGVLTLQQDYQVGTFLDTSWPVSCTLASLAAYGLILQHRRAATKELETTPEFESDEGLTSQRLPRPEVYLLVPAQGLLLAYVMIADLPHFIEQGAFLSAVVVLMALLAQQFLTQRENAGLVDRLRTAYEDLREKRGEAVEQKRLVQERHDELLAMTDRLESKNRELQVANKKLEALVTVDGMTGLANHRSFHERLRTEVEAAQKYDHPLSLLIGDLDRFKEFNETHGHPSGDEAIRQVAKILFDEIGAKDLAARYAGEEFAVLLPYVGANEARLLAQRIGDQVRLRAASVGQLTISIGVCEIGPGIVNGEGLIEEASRALQAAKVQGRDCVRVATEVRPRLLTLEADTLQPRIYDPSTPLGLAAVVSAAVRNHPQALALEPDTQVILGLLSALQLKGGESLEHAERLMWASLRLAKSAVDLGMCQLGPSDLKGLAYGALLHDIGKFAVPESTLRHRGALDPEMRRQFQSHPEQGAILLKRFTGLLPALPVVQSHHERWDGAGYPDGKREEEIPLIARIFSVVDAFDAMTSGRPYRQAISHKEAEKELARCSGTQFDPLLIQAFLCVPNREWALPAEHPALRTPDVVR